MTDSPITIRFRWTADELLKARHYHFRHVCRRAFRILLHLIFALMLIAGVGSLLGGKITFLPIVLTFFGVYWFAIRPFEKRWATRRQFAKRPDKDSEVEWEIASDLLKTTSAHGKSEFTWDAIAKVVVTPDGLLLYPTDQIFHWLPQSAFADRLEFIQVAELARGKVVRFFEVV